MLTDDTLPEEIATVERLRGLRDVVTTEMGGPEAVGAIRAAGRRTAREHIAELVDPARSAKSEPSPPSPTR